jgi:hypothetical protein
MTLDEAKNLKTGQRVYHTIKKNADGSAMRAKVLSIKVWKRSPEKVLVSLKHGMYDYAKFDETEIRLLSVKE